jgi:quinolinate synthase
METRSLFDAIEEHRRLMGSDLIVVGHHYQEDDVIRHADFQGDSLELSRKVSDAGTPHIMFCGVYFMAESAALLAGERQRVYLPEPSAECSMALMSPAPLLEEITALLAGSGRKIVPLAYVNSTLAVKAFTGKHGGGVCTSANAGTMLEWALEQGDAVLFLPDKNLGNNTADAIGLPEQDRHVLNIRDKGGRLDLSSANKARLLLWPGFCSIHTRFALRQIERVRAEYPDATVMVHPECTPQVVAAADLAGSTSAIIRFAENLPDGSTLCVGTEINLVQRLGERHRGRITVLPLVESACTHMAQTTEESLAKALDSLSAFMKDGTPSPFLVRVPDSVRAPAEEALRRMLSTCR